MTPPKPARREHFDEWAGDYDMGIEAATGFPFEGYDAVLDRVVEQVMDVLPHAGQVVDLGVGTGNLSVRLKAARPDAVLTGVDFSAAMLDQAADKVDGIRLVRAGLTPALAIALDATPDVVMASYTLHELSCRERVQLARALIDRGARAIVVGDIGWPTRRLRREARQRFTNQWDDDEHYLADDEEAAALASEGLHATYEQVSFCAGIWVIRPAP